MIRIVHWNVIFWSLHVRLGATVFRLPQVSLLSSTVVGCRADFSELI